MLLLTLSFSSMICCLYAASWCWMSYSPFSFRVDQRFTSSWLNLRRHSSHFSNRLTVILETFLHPETFLWETLITRLQSIIRVYREIHTHSLLLFLCAGGPWRTVGLCEESYLCHRIWNLILGCIRQLADMVGVTVLKCNQPVNLRWTWHAVWAVHIMLSLIGAGLVLFYGHYESILFVFYPGESQWKWVFSV